MVRARIELPPASRQFGGLLAAARPLGQVTDEWTRGVVFSGRGCVAPAMRGPCDNDLSTGGPIADTAARPSDGWSFTPTTVRQGTECTTLSRFDGGRMSAARLDTSREWAAGHILQTGDHTEHQLPGGGTQFNPALVDGTSLTAPPLDVVDAVACAEQVAADELFGAPAVLHASPLLATHMLAAAAMERDGRVWRTALGSLVVVSPGYTGADLYVTGEVFAAAGERQIDDQPRSQVDRSVNTQTVWADELVLSVFDACWHGVVTTTVSDCTTAT